MAEKKSKYPFNYHGYIYSKGTRAGFLRMQRMGIPRPLFSIEDRLQKVVAIQYKEFVKNILNDIKRAASQTNATLDHALVQDEALDDLLDFFDEKKKETDDIINQANMGAAENTLEHNWFDGGDEDVSLKRQEITKNQIGNILQQEQDDYLGRLFKDAGSEMQNILLSFSLDKQAIFNDNMDRLRALYLDNSIQRLTWEQDYIKRAMLRRIHRYVTGQDQKLRLDDLTKLATAKGEHMARLFARDQMQRFNKALTLSTFQNAGVTKIKWVTSHDQRVRPSHKALDGQVFDIENLPEEIDDYNCRCGLVPVAWE